MRSERTAVKDSRTAVCRSSLGTFAPAGFVGRPKERRSGANASLLRMPLRRKGVAVLRRVAWTEIRRSDAAAAFHGPSGPAGKSSRVRTVCRPLPAAV